MSSPHRIDRVNGKPPTSSWKNEDGGDGKPQPDVVDNCDVNNSTKPLIPSMSATGADVTTARIPSGALWKSFEQLLPSFLPSAGFMLKSFLGVTVSLYILNQKHLLPKPLSRIVSKCLFWPTLPITVVRRLGSWETVIDGTVIMGGAPFGFAKIPEKLYEQYGVRSVINMCEEYRGPIRKYKELGITSLRLPTVDHFEPSIADLEAAIQFIEKCHSSGTKVYVHCRAGHGRSAAVVLGWLLSRDSNANLKELNDELSRLRNVRKTLWKQPNMIRFHERLKRKKIDSGSGVDDQNDEL